MSVVLTNQFISFFIYGTYNVCMQISRNNSFIYTYVRLPMHMRISVVRLFSRKSDTHTLNNCARKKSGLSNSSIILDMFSCSYFIRSVGMQAIPDVWLFFNLFFFSLFLHILNVEFLLDITSIKKENDICWFIFC